MTALAVYLLTYQHIPAARTAQLRADLLGCQCRPAGLPVSSPGRRPARRVRRAGRGWRTRHGAQAWLRVRGYISTARKNSLHIITALRDAIAGNSWLPTTIETY
ncbi:hypothetical protein AB0F15_32350 [Amycolatopsis sp. NPDC026612]|uniref:hypothetical protein n=1 Tax=Amycolatopsis sp. NPDC026612 TaxID=3155466 RepID=UPI0033E546AB